MTSKLDSKTAKKRSQWPRVRFIDGRAKPWWVDGRRLEDGKRAGERHFFETAGEADAKAEEIRNERKFSGSGGLLSDQLRADAIDAESRLAAVGATIRQAVDYFLAHARPSGGEKAVRAVVDEFIASKRAAGRKETYLGVQEYVLGNVFAGEFGERPIHTITAPEIEKWMGAKPWSMRTRLNYFSDLRNLLGFAIRKGYRPTNPMGQLEKPAVTVPSPGVLTVDQARALLTVCASGEREMLAAVALGLFAGVRTEELEHLDWRHVDLAENNIHVPPEIAKTREGRDIEIHATLRAWLLPLAGSGQIAPPRSYDWRLNSKATAAGIVDRPKNALRHSFASYHFAAFKNAPLTASMLGHMGSTATFEKRYKRRVTPSEAGRYWAIMPRVAS